MDTCVGAQGEGRGYQGRILMSKSRVLCRCMLYHLVVCILDTKGEVLSDATSQKSIKYITKRGLLCSVLGVEL